MVLLTLDGSQQLTAEDRALLGRAYEGELIVLLNKADLPAQTVPAEVQKLAPHAEVLVVSAHDARTLQPLKQRLSALAERCGELPLTQQRHLQAARRAEQSLREAAGTLSTHGLELAAVDLRQAIAALGEITGDEVEERILDEVFSNFCVGK